MNAEQPELEVRLFGYPQVSWLGQTLKLPTTKSLAVLCYLAVRPGGATRNELAELLWPPAAKANLRPELHRLRHLLGAGTWLETGETVRVTARTDLHEFESLVQHERFRDALTLCPASEVVLRGLEPKGSPAFADWVTLERQRVNTLLRHALRQHSQALEQRGAYAEALELIRQLIELDALDESAYRAAMRCEYQRGQVEAALGHFEACRRILKVELDVEPLAETHELALDIQSHRAPAFCSHDAPKRRIPKQLFRPPLLVGRDCEWADLEAAWQAGRTINLSGPAGIGKTRLVTDFARSKGSSFVLQGRPGDRSIPYSSLTRALKEALARFPDIGEKAAPWIHAELDRVLPGTSARAGSAGSSEVSEARFFEAVVRLIELLRQRVKTIVVEDLQHLDIKSFDAGMAAQARLLDEPLGNRQARLVATFRASELPEAFSGALDLAVDFGIATHITLEPLGEEATGAMLHSLDVGPAKRLAPPLHRLTGGNPQYLVETLKRLYETGRLPHLPANGSDLRESVAEVLKKRLRGLSKPALELAQALAILRQSAAPELLVHLLDADQSALNALFELEDARIVKDGLFVHDLLLATVIELTPPVTRDALHRRIAGVLENTAADPLQIAHHWQQGGEPHRAQKHRLAAAHSYQATGLHAEAIKILKQIGRHRRDAQTRDEVHLAQANSYLELGRYQEARAALTPLRRCALSPLVGAQVRELTALIRLGEGHLREAAKLASTARELGEAVGDDPLRQRLLLLQARIEHRRERHQHALDLLAPLHAELQAAGPSTSLATVTSEIAAVYDSLGRSEQALPLHYRALELAHKLGARHLQVLASNHLIYGLLELGRSDEAIEIGEAALALGSYRNSDPLRANLARAYLVLQRFADARRHYLYLGERSADPALQTAAWARLAELYHRTGRSGDVQPALSRALAGLKHTDYGRAHARVAIATLRHGTATQRAELESCLNALEISALPGYLKDDLMALRPAVLP